MGGICTCFQKPEEIKYDLFLYKPLFDSPVDAFLLPVDTKRRETTFINLLNVVEDFDKNDK